MTRNGWLLGLAVFAAAIAALTWYALRDSAPAPVSPGPDADVPPVRVPRTGRAGRDPPEPPPDDADARPEPPAGWTEERFRREIATLLAARPDAGTAPPATPGELDAAARKALESWRIDWDVDQQAPEETARSVAAGLAARIALRAKTGALQPGPVTIEIRARGTGWTTAVAERPEQPLHRFDAFAAPAAPLAFESEVEGGLIPGGHVLVVERMEIEGTLPVPASIDSAEPPTIHAALSRREQWRFTARLPRLRAVFEGARVLAAGDEPDVRLSLSSATARLRLSGRVVPAAEVPPARDLAWVAAESEGFLQGNVAVRLHARCGPNPSIDVAWPARVQLDGLSDRVGAKRAPYSSHPLWPDADPAESKREVWSEGTGLVPPGHVLHVTELEWRVRFVDESAPPSFGVDAPTGKLVERRGRHGREDAGTWTGDVAVAPGEEWKLSVRSYAGAVGEAVVRGRVEPAR